MAGISLAIALIPPMKSVPGGGGGPVIPPNALLDEDGNPILDEDGNFILVE